MLAGKGVKTIEIHMRIVKCFDLVVRAFCQEEVLPCFLKKGGEELPFFPERAFKVVIELLVDQGVETHMLEILALVGPC